MTIAETIQTLEGCKIERIDTIPVSVPVRSGTGLKQGYSDYVLVRLESADGLTGIGEASVHPSWSGETQAGCMALVQQFLAPRIEGMSPFSIELIAARMNAAVVGNPFAKAAVEMACLDMAGKALGRPVWDLLGGQVRERAEVRYVVGHLAPAEAAIEAQRGIDLGFRTIKVKVGPDPAVDLARVRAVREAIGPSVKLTVDANGRWDVVSAVEAIRRFEVAGLEVSLVEQPVPREPWGLMREVKLATGARLIADESCFSLSDAYALARDGAADVLSIYPGKNGGLLATKKIAAVAEAAGLTCLIGSNLELGIATAAMIHLALSTPVVRGDRHAHDVLGPLYHNADVVKRSPTIVDGFAELPPGPGLGVELDPDAVREFGGNVNG